MHLYQINFILCTATLPGMWERTVTIGSAGKTYSVTGWKVRRININELNYIECIYYSKNTSVFYDLCSESFWQIFMSPKCDNTIQLEQLPIFNTHILIIFFSLN